VFNVSLPVAAPVSSASAPLMPAWAVARTNGKAALLPEDRAEVYERLAHEAEQLEGAKERLRKVQLDTIAFGLRLGTAVEAGATLHLIPADRDILMQSLASELASYIEVIHWNALWAGACEAVADNVTSTAAMTPYLRKRLAALPPEFN